MQHSAYSQQYCIVDLKSPDRVNLLSTLTPLTSHPPQQ